ncbi:MAG: hypothetical protein ABH967_00205 [Patescibacteria group bacterium]
MKTFSEFKIKNFLLRLPRTLAFSAFKTFLFLIVIFIALSALFAYKYIILVQKEEVEPAEKILDFNQNVYQDVLDIWNEREERFNKIDIEKYYDSFR